MFLPRYFNVIRCEAVTQKQIHNHVSFKRRRLLGASHESPLRTITLKATHAARAVPPSKSSLQDITVFSPGDGDQFPAAQGFWPESSSDQVEISAKVLIADPRPRSSREHNNELQPPKPEVSQENPLEELLTLLPRFRASKRNLSYLDLNKWESSAKSKSFRSTTEPAFRANTGLRKILFSYLRLLRPHLHQKDIQHFDADLDHALLQTFSPHNQRLLRRYGYDPHDVVSWSWILGAGSARGAIKRCTALAQDLQQQGRNGIPIFVPLQILRAENVDGPSLRALIQMMENMIHGSGDVEDHSQPHKWDHTSAAVLTIRLVRHARKVAPTTLNDIVLLLQHLTKPKSRPTPVILQRLSHFYNRLLGLLALPAPVKPFRSVEQQQKAQLSLVRHMLEIEPQIPLNREGYRALVQVQLAHRKTEDERDWAGAKMKSWPPWRKDRLGMEASKDYPGQQSRASKILGRMHEAGYDHFAWEKSAKILAGWDTDRSPTIQHRGTLKKKAMSWVAEFFSPHAQPRDKCDPNIWAARVTATRTTREAWACFLAFRREPIDRAQSSSTYPVYHAMFDKLFARPYAGRPSSKIVPGDVKEVFADPTAPKDLIYVESDPPTVNELYENMLESGLKPAGKLLEGLLNYATNLADGLRYIKDSHYSETRKDVLLHAEKYDGYFIQKTLRGFTNHFLASYIKFLCQCDADYRYPLILPKSLRAGGDRLPIDINYVTPIDYGRQMLYISVVQYTPAWNAHLTGLNVQLKKDFGQRFRLWDEIRSTLTLMSNAKSQPDFATFQEVSEFSERCLLFRTQSSFRDQEFLETSTNLFKSIIRSHNKDNTNIGGGSVPREDLPDPEHLLALVRLLGIAQDYTGIQELADWMNQHAISLIDVAAERTSGNLTIHRLVTLIRVFVDWCPQELLKYEVPTIVSRELSEDIQLQCKPFGWPSDAEMYEFVNEHQGWLKGVVSAIMKGTIVARRRRG